MSEWPFAEHDLPVLDSTMHYHEAGDGEPIVFLHGNPTSSYLWRNVIPRLEREGRCLAPDLIGMGRSRKPEIGYRLFDHARYLDAWFATLDLRNVTLVVHDWGSTLGISWARQHADRVAGIAMMEPIVRNGSWEEWPSEELVAMFKGFRTPGKGEQLILEENRFIEQVLPGGILRKLTVEEMEAYRAPFADPKSRRPVLQWPREIPMEGEPADVVELVGDLADWLANSPVPKLLLTFDPGVLMDRKAVEWARTTFKNLEVHHIGRGIHMVQEDHPEAIGDAVKDWRRRHLFAS